MPSPFTTLRRKFSVWESFFSLICWHKSIIFWLKLLIGEKIFRLGKIYLLLKILPFLISFPNFVYLSCVIVYKMLFTRWLFTGLTNGRCKRSTTGNYLRQPVMMPTTDPFHRTIHLTLIDRSYINITWRVVKVYYFFIFICF